MQNTIKRVVSFPDADNISHLVFVGDNEEQTAASLELKFVSSENNFLKEMIGGTILLKDVFVTDQYFRPDYTPPGTTNPTGESEVTGEFQAKFIISNAGGALLKVGNLDSIPGSIYDRFVGIEDDILPYGISRIGLQGKTSVYFGMDLNDITNLYDSVFNQPTFAPDGEIIIKSISIKPDGVPTNYRWEITGWDNDDPSGDDTWERIVAGTDVTITPYSNQTVEGLIITEDNSLEGSKIKIRLHSWDMHIGIKLTITNSTNDSSTLHLPCCIETGRP